MKIIVAGCGKIGTAILSVLSSEHYDVTAIDPNPEVVERISDTYDVMSLCGNGADDDAMREAGVAQTDIFIATSDSDELNMLMCFLARKMGAKHTVARIRAPEYNDSSLDFLKQHLDLSMALNPERLAAHEILNILKFPFATKIENFVRRDFELVELKLPGDSQLDGLTLRRMREQYNARYLICAVQRGEEIYIPSGDFVLRSGDKIGVSASPKEIQDLMKKLGLHKRQVKSVMILGGGITTYYLAKALLPTGTSVKILEKDPEVCKELSAEFPSAIVLNADGKHNDTLLEEGLADVDAFVALSDSDEDNILICKSVMLQRKAMSAANKNDTSDVKVIAVIRHAELIDLAQKIDIDTIFSPLELTSNALVRYARALRNSDGSNVESLYKLMDGKVEAIEFSIAANSTAKFLNVPLRDLTLKENNLIGGILRKRKPIIPTGETVIQPGDHVVILTTGTSLMDLSEILTVKVRHE